MKKPPKDKKINKKLKKRKVSQKIILDKLEEKIDYGKDRPPHW